MASSTRPVTKMGHTGKRGEEEGPPMRGWGRGVGEGLEAQCGALSTQRREVPSSSPAPESAQRACKECDRRATPCESHRRRPQARLNVLRNSKEGGHQGVLSEPSASSRCTAQDSSCPSLLRKRPGAWDMASRA
eukprot:scaffold181821_cov29-Tisochrysis_lutea.AAC.3